MKKSSSRIEHYSTEHPRSRARFGLIRTYLRDRPFEFLTASGVFSKDHLDLGTRLLIESMVLPEEGCLLDIGCGYGAVGIAAGALNLNLHVVMVDLNMRAVRLARRNIELNQVRNAEVRHGHLYSPVCDLVFSCVVSNPPVSAGMKVVEGIITEGPEHLSCRGTLQMVVRSKIGGKRLQSIFENTFGNVDVLARGSGYRVLISRKT